MVKAALKLPNSNAMQGLSAWNSGIVRIRVHVRDRTHYTNNHIGHYEVHHTLCDQQQCSQNQ